MRKNIVTVIVTIIIVIIIIIVITSSLSLLALSLSYHGRYNTLVTRSRTMNVMKLAAMYAIPRARKMARFNAAPFVDTFSTCTNGEKWTAELFVDAMPFCSVKEFVN